MTTDNRTNEPKQTKSKSSQDFVFTEAQIEAAAKAVADAMFPRWVECDRVLRSRDEGSLIRTAARAALVAAACAAPQAPKDIHEPNHDRVYCVRCGGNWPCQPAPVQPSSTVDEAALAEVIATANYDWSQQRLEFWRRPASVESPGSLDEFTARAIAEYLTGGAK